MVFEWHDRVSGWVFWRVCPKLFIFHVAPVFVFAYHGSVFMEMHGHDMCNDYIIIISTQRELCSAPRRDLCGFICHMVQALAILSLLTRDPQPNTGSPSGSFFLLLILNVTEFEIITLSSFEGNKIRHWYGEVVLWHLSLNAINIEF